MTRRRLVFALISLAAYLVLFSIPSPVDAQQPAVARHVGVLLVAHSSESEVAQKFRQGIRDAGYSEGRDVMIEWRSANGDYDRVPELVSDLVERNVEVIVVDGTVGTRAAKRATSTIPIVMALVADPVGSGLVANLAHPGGNITGLTIMMPDLSTKQLQLAQGDSSPSSPGRSPVESRLRRSARR